MRLVKICEPDPCAEDAAFGAFRSLKSSERPCTLLALRSKLAPALDMGMNRLAYFRISPRPIGVFTPEWKDVCPHMIFSQGFNLKTRGGRPVNDKLF